MRKAPLLVMDMHWRAGTGAAPPLSVRLLDHCGGDAADIVPAWDVLAGQASEPNPFLESWYLLPALRALDPEGAVRLFVVERGDAILGLMPLSRETRYYRRPIPHLAGWMHPNAFLGAPLIAQGHGPEFWDALIGWADRNAGRALFLHLSELALDGPVFAGLAEVAQRRGRLAAIVYREARALLQSDVGPEPYFTDSLSGKKRKELRRQFKRLEELGAVTVERRHDLQGLGEWTEEFLRLEAAGWKGKAGSALASAESTAALFREALAGAAARGKLERLALRFDGRAIAMLATFLCPPGAFSYKTAFDESFARFSPGVLLQRENLAMLERSDIAWTDSCAAADHAMIDHIWRERREVGRISVAIGGPLRRTAFGLLARAELRRRNTGACA